jgi:hypothetical protein
MTLFIILQTSSQMVKGFQGLWWGGEGSNFKHWTSYDYALDEKKKSKNVIKTKDNKPYMSCS